MVSTFEHLVRGDLRQRFHHNLAEIAVRRAVGTDFAAARLAILDVEKYLGLQRSAIGALMVPDVEVQRQSEADLPDFVEAERFGSVHAASGIVIKTLKDAPSVIWFVGRDEPEVSGQRTLLDLLCHRLLVELNLRASIATILRSSFTNDVKSAVAHRFEPLRPNRIYPESLRCPLSFASELP